MLKSIISLIVFLALALLVFSMCSNRKPVTRGELRDREAASEVVRCARQYLRNSQPDDERQDIWTMCLDTVVESGSRNATAIARNVNRLQRRDIFSFDSE